MEMPMEWVIIFLGTIAMSVYFSWKSGFNTGVVEATEFTLTRLEEMGLINVEEDGTINKQ